MPFARRQLRVLFAGAWLLAQAVLIITAAKRADHAYGFRMFDQSAVVQMHLQRRVDGPSGPTLVPVEYGSWSARDQKRTRHQIYWRDRVTVRELCVFDVRTDAAYGAAAQLSRLQAALDDVASHIPDDAETLALVADVDVWDAGRAPRHVHLESQPRAR
jgi:hypothetical protein